MVTNAEMLLQLARLEAVERQRAAEQERLARTVISVHSRRKP